MTKLVRFVGIHYSECHFCTKGKHARFTEEAKECNCECHLAAPVPQTYHQQESAS